MAGYQPLYIKGVETGLVQERENFLLPDDAYPVLQNAYVWRERIKRKQCYELLGRLRHVIPSTTLTTTNLGAFTQTFNIFFLEGIVEPNATIEVGSIVVTIAGGNAANAATYTDNGDGTFTTIGNGNAATTSVNYTTGNITLGYTNAIIAPASNINVAFNYFPNLPVMGLRSRELTNINFEQLVAFDQKYAYIFNNGWQEFIPGFQWSGNDSQFFWSTNYWVTPANKKLFWATNFNPADPIRYTDDSVWIDFAPTINAAGDKLTQCLAMLPYRGRLVTFNTIEKAVPYTNRIRWAAIGNPISDVSALFPIANISADAWRDDIRGKGGFLDIPTAEAIVSVGFVRDNCVIYCERSTWQLRYTGRSIAPFQIERVNSELGAESTFSAVQFDTSLVGVGDKGIVECDSFKSDRIDIKIPDLVFQFNNDSDGTKRIHGIRDFVKRLAYWTFPYKPNGSTFPDMRLVYNYENDSWSIFTDSLTTLGTFQPADSRRWLEYTHVSKDQWAKQNYPWIDRPSGLPAIVGGNQQGFVEYLDETTTNDVSLYIKDITGGANIFLPTVITSQDHNMQTGQVITIFNIPTGTPFAASLNENHFSIVKIDNNSFSLMKFNPVTQDFVGNPQLDDPAVYIGGGEIALRDNFSITSKKFNFVDDGQNIQLGFIDILMDDTDEGAITLNVYMDYNDSEPINTYPENNIPSTSLPDTFFNTVIPTTVPVDRDSSKNWQRVFCPARAAFLTLEYTLSNAQMVGVEQESDVQIDAQILWIRRAGRQLPIGI